MSDGTVMTLLQTNAAINSGNSGGDCKRIILRRIQTHLVRAEPAVFYKSEVVFPHCNRACTTTDSLEICVRNPAYSLDCRKQGSSHSVATCHILGSAFGHEPLVCAHLVREDYCIKIIGTLRRRDDLDAVIQRTCEPESIDIVFRNGYQQRNVVVRADLRKGTCCVSRRCHYQNPVVVLIQSSAYGICFGLLE